jgi:metal-responsive CopG/Arc/MetJ family transcriptional regulator
MSKKRVKDEPALYDEIKVRAMMSLTPTAIKELDKKAAELGISRSEFVERVAREIIVLPEQEKAIKKPKQSKNLSRSG